MVFVWLSPLDEVTGLNIFLLGVCPSPISSCSLCLLFLPTLFGLFCLPSLVLERKWSSLALDQPGLPSAVFCTRQLLLGRREGRLCAKCAQAERACPAASYWLAFLGLSGGCSKFILWLSGCRQIMARQRLLSPCWCQLISWLRSGFASLTRNCNLAPRVCPV